ncbi:MAG: CBS domain-containing protein [Haloferacaceae archaeon]
MPVRKLAVEPVTAERGTAVRRLAEIMDEERLGDLIVVEGDRPVGIVTDRDLALAIARHDDLDSLTAGDVMTADPVTIRGDAEDFELAETFAEARVRRLPVVDDDGALTGVVTLDDLVATVGEELKDVATVIEAQSREYEPE